MAKTVIKNGNGWIKYASFALTVGLILTSIVLAWSDQKKDSAIISEKLTTFILTEDKRISRIEQNGTSKSNENELKIISIVKDMEFTVNAIEDIKVEQKAFRADQKTYHAEIINQINKNGKTL